MMLLTTMMTVAMMMQMLEMIKLDDGNDDGYVHDHDHYDDD